MLGERWPEAQGSHRFRSKALTQRRGRSSCQSLCSEFSEWPEPEGGAGLGSGAGTAASRLRREAVLAPSVALQKLSNLQVLRLHVVSSYCCSPLPVRWIARTFILPSLADSEDWRFLIDTDKQPFALNAQGNVFLCHAQRDCVNIKSTCVLGEEHFSCAYHFSYCCGGCWLRPVVEALERLRQEDCT